MRQIRRNVFETNSSSTHSITMCMKSDFDKWIAGELIYEYGEGLIPITDAIKKEIEENGYDDYLTYEQFCDYHLDTFVKSFATPNNEKVVSFGYYGYDG